MSVKGGIESVKILGVQIILSDAKCLAEALIVNYLALTKELDRIADIGIVNKTQNVVVGHTCLLLC